MQLKLCGHEVEGGVDMKKFIKLLLRHWVKTPLKITLTLLSVALGTGILILSFSAGSILKNEIVSKMEKEGVILYAVNGEWSSTGNIDQERPGTWDSSVYDYLKTDGATIDEVAIIVNFPMPDFVINGKSYKIRNIIGTDHSYMDVFSLEIISGDIMTEEDFNSGFKKVWISEETAILLFGSSQNAIGQKIAPPGKEMERGGRTRGMISQYTVTGVYETPLEVARRSYGIADMIFPVTSFFPIAEKGLGVLDFLSGRIVVKSSSGSVEKASAEITQIVKNNYGEDTLITVWEGNTRGTSSYMEELRQTVSIFTVSVNILGIVLLLTSSLGIFSIMVVEALGRRREIALERSLGASQMRVVREFWSWSIMLTLFGALIGVLLAFILEKPVLGTLAPLLGELSNNFSENSGIQVKSLISGFLLALGCGGILGLLPAFSAVKGNIADTLREA